MINKGLDILYIYVLFGLTTSFNVVFIYNLRIKYKFMTDSHGIVVETSSYSSKMW